MIYLIAHLAPFLLLTAAFAALAGWAYAAERAASGEAAARRERENLLRDLIRFTGGDAPEEAVDLDAAPTQRLLEIRDGRIAELERSLEAARARVDELSGEVAEVQRGGRLNDLDADELARLRAAESARERTLDAEAEPVEEENTALQAWRLRYFEQRVSYLENHKSPPEDEPAAPPALNEGGESTSLLEWRAREASARAAFLEDELRALRGAGEPPAPAPATETDAFAADADVDMLLRWRLLYLERRVAYLQQRAAAAAETQPAPQPVAGPDPDRWKWRARYLEARVRHLEERPPAVAVEAQAPAVAEPPAPVRAAAPLPSRRSKPPVLASARNGAPDDLTLIEGVSLLQQTTLYALGIFHFDQIAAWSDENVAWVDQYLRLQGRIGEEEWLEQARELAAHGPAAARRALESEDA